MRRLAGRGIWLCLFATLVLIPTGCRTAQSPAAFTDWPAGASPDNIGSLVASNFLGRSLGYKTDPGHPHVHYAEAGTWYGALAFAHNSNRRGLESALIEKFNPLLKEDVAAIPPRPHVDDRVFGIVPLEIYQLDADRRCLELGLRLANDQWTNTTPDGITSDARYWIDDMYMITALQVQAWRATGNEQYLDRAARTMAAYLDRLQKTNGLFVHAPDSPFYWGRGNGWVAAGMTELLRSLPASHPQRTRILAGYRRMMESLLKYQGADGLWRQLIDHPESWPESSSTGMFTFAMITGVRHGWLEESTYGPAARKGWLGLVGYIDAKGNVREVCEGTGKGYSVQYYMDRHRNIGDFHGQAPVLWCAMALTER